MAVGAQTSFNGKRQGKASLRAETGKKSQRPLPQVVIAALQKGVAEHQAGRLAEAAALYQQVLKERPTQPDALHLLGVIHHQNGDSRTAVTLIRKAVKADPDNAKALINLGAALTSLGQIEEAEQALISATERLPDSAEAQGNLAAVREAQHRPEAAMALYRRASDLSPGNVKYLRRFAEMAFAAESWQIAADAYGRYLEIVPDDVSARNELGVALNNTDLSQQAIEHLNRVAAERPDDPYAHSNLGNALAKAGHLDEAEMHYRRSVELDGQDWRLRINLANLLWEIGRFEEAQTLSEAVIEERPDDAMLMQQVASRLIAARHPEAAKALLERALRVAPDLAEIHNALGNLQALRLELEEALAHYLKAIELKPHYLLAHLNVCVCLDKLRRFDEAAVRAIGLRIQPDYAANEPACMSRILQILKSVCDFDGLEMQGDFWPVMEDSPAAHLSPTLLTLLALAEDDDHIRRLALAIRRIGGDSELKAAWKARSAPTVLPRMGRIKVGLVSADFRNHSAARCILPLFRHYDRDRFEFRCYSAVSGNDSVQKEIASQVDAFVEIDQLDDPTASDAIRSDGVEALFDLSGWTAHSRLPLFAFRPAPHQIAWLGWPFTSGFASIGHFLVDRFNAPAAEGLLLEKPLVVDGPWIAFEQLTQTQISPSPFQQNGHITFGTLNNTYKITRSQIALWARIMAAVPGSRFLMARAEARSRIFVRNMIVEFGKYGIGEDRLEIVGQGFDSGSHFNFYHQFDISLDTFPVVGGVTTVDSLWMGVPVVAMYGSAFHQRIGHSILNHCGLGEFSVPTPDDFIETACRLAADTDRLAELRAELRPRVQASPLFDGPAFAKHFGATIAHLVGAPA
jgi:protein O-GlcNAc transferase